MQQQADLQKAAMFGMKPSVEIMQKQVALKQQFIDVALETIEKEKQSLKTNYGINAELLNQVDSYTSVKDWQDAVTNSEEIQALQGEIRQP